MISAGFGDLLGKYTALADWRLGHVIEREGFSPTIDASVRRAVDECTGALVGSGGEKYIRSLTESLVESGSAMLRWGGSRPASGAEHHIAHFLEMWEARGKGEDHLHGTRVGVAEVYVTAVYHNIFRLDARSVRENMDRRKTETAAARAERIRAAYGPQAREILSEQGGHYLDESARRHRQTAIMENWDFLQDWVKRNVPHPGRVRGLLAAAGAPSSFADLGLAAPATRTILQSAKEVRGRYTVFRLAEDLGLAPEDLIPDVPAQGQG
jgi:glycerol-1-phosphate dehydrogenase [NAD(P)+]